MATTTPTAAGTQLQKGSDRRVTLRRLFENQRPELSKLLPRGMSPDRLFRMALTECVKNPKLLECTAESWALAIQTCAAQGLYPDSGLGYMYLIPSNNSKKDARGGWQKVMEVRAQRGYQGDIALARKSGELADIYAEVVHAKDQYKVTKGLNRNIEHVPYDGDDDPGALRACYAVAKLRSGEIAWVTLTKRDVERHKKSAQGTDREDSPWRAHEDAMWKKTAVRELFKWLPKASEEAERIAAEISGAAEAPEPAIDVSAVSVPIDEPADPLDRLTEELTARGGDQEAADQPAPKGCAHPAVPPSRVAGLAHGKSIACPDCGEELSNPEAKDPAVPEPTPAPKKSGQGRLSE